LVVINDCSPEPELVDYLNQFANDNKITLLHNDENLGFVGTVNRGMALHSDRDVLLLNSDAEVFNDWLDRISGCAYQETKIATITPFSNNATICSYPRFCEDNELLEDIKVNDLDLVFAKANAQ
jgi:O-antigen biosynthesis protein